MIVKRERLHALRGRIKRIASMLGLLVVRDHLRALSEHLVRQSHALRERLIREVVLRSIPRATERLIVFLTPGFNWRCGGVRSIVMHFVETRRMAKIHGAHVLIATLPGDPWLLKYTWFKNNIYLVPFEAIAQRFTQLDWLMIHVPEYAINQFQAAISSEERLFHGLCANMHINVMLQNIDMIEGQHINALQPLGKVTCTTAHLAYCTETFRRKFGVPLHQFGVFIDPAQYFLTTYQNKENLLLVSPDVHPLKEQLLAKIQEAHANLRIQTIHNLSYEEYKHLISRAKWSITFGEGLDGFFSEPILSGGIGFAVYNERFFTPEWLTLDNVYPTWEEFENRIVSDLERLDNIQAYNNCWSQAFNHIAQYDVDGYRENLRNFYLGDYDHP